MADKAISELIAANQVTPTDLFVLEQSGTAKKLTGQTLENWLVSLADGHGGIQSIAKVGTNFLEDTYRITLADTTTFDFIVTNGKAISSVEQTSTNGLIRTYTIAFNDGTSQTFTVTDGRGITSITQTAENGLSRTYTISMNDGTSETFTITDGRSITDIEKTSTNLLTDTYTITFNDGTTSTFTVKNGNGIQSFAKVSTDGLMDTYRIEYNDGTSDEFTVTNGAKGDKGDNTFTHIKFASQEPTEASHSIGDIPDNWIGFYWGSSEEAPEDWQQYKWFEIKGQQGNPGAAATLVSFTVEYQTSDSGTIIPSGVWSASVPVVAQGRYLWTRTTIAFNTGSPVVSHSVSRMGLDGSGSVSSVANISPDENGNVPLSAADVGALSNTGGDLIGELRMNGQPISGLNMPTSNDQAANMGFVNQQMRKAAPYNHLHNSDFFHFVALAGVGGKHGTQAYAGDRWILDSGTVTGSQNADGTGYTDITLNGTIRQIVANAPDGATAAVEMVSGTAEIAYTNGEVTITSAGGVIRGADLFVGNFTAAERPVYQPRGYAAELAECQRYYRRIGNTKSNTLLGTALGYTETILYFGIPGIAMRGVYSVNTVTDIATLQYTTGTLAAAQQASGVAAYNANDSAVTMSVSGSFERSQSYSLWLVKGIIEISADL